MKKTKNVRIDADLHAVIRAEAERQGRTFAGQLRVIVADYFDETPRLAD